ncbi:E3 ubiquitin-protein ligase RNF180 [Eublepharis macularius]|uniref:E3 ubiquitin-protein ligase RNF180 n=1 Tax=Eublepharis macularius TaxID=481883 RepID=A0AA97L5I1_EUBMA|nr:E3 ubiquitin-protein ligase RNF180 [Eublepharis macularius]
MNSPKQVDMLRCWKCRKYVANSGCLVKDQTTDLFDKPHSSAAHQDVCNVWHMKVEALPDWVTNEIAKAEWTTGKLNCPFCGAHLGGFNFVHNTKCSCGRFKNIHLCKRQTDCQKASPVTLKHLSFCKAQPSFNKEMWQSVTGGTLGNQGLSYMAKNNSSIGRLMEALCLEVRSTSFEMNGKKLHFKVSYPKTSLSASLAVNDRCTVRAFHRKSQSLDLNFREKLVLSPTLYGSSTTQRPFFSRQHETQPFYTKGCIQLKFNRTHNYFNCPLKSDIGELPTSFSVTAYSVLAQEQTEFKNSLEASKHYIENATPDQHSYLTSSERTAKDYVGQQPLSLLHPMATEDQKLNKRKRIRLNSLRRKQSWKERRRQKWTMNDNVNTDEVHEQRRDKESYLCAVCLDVYYNPYMCYPCHHIFCEPCLRTLAKDNPTSTPCPLCRTIIAQVYFQSELNNYTKTRFPMEYLKLKENFQESSLVNWPLPSCKKALKVIEGFQRSTDSFTRRHFPHAAHRMDYMDFEDDSRGWRFDMDMVIIYIYSINWVIGFIVFCFLCYFFFPF